jgi:hypothetical protein
MEDLEDGQLCNTEPLPLGSTQESLELRRLREERSTLVMQLSCTTNTSQTILGSEAAVYKPVDPVLAELNTRLATVVTQVEKTRTSKTALEEPCQAYLRGTYSEAGLQEILAYSLKHVQSNRQCQSDRLLSLRDRVSHSGDSLVTELLLTFSACQVLRNSESGSTEGIELNRLETDMSTLDPFLSAIHMRGVSLRHGLVEGLNSNLQETLARFKQQTVEVLFQTIQARLGASSHDKDLTEFQ